MTDYQERFIEREKYHIDLVNKYAAIIGHCYSHHDFDKLQGELFEPYSLSKKYNQFYNTTDGLTDDELEEYNKATLKHITRNPHHPEYWVKDKRVLNDFDRNNPPRELDCSLMSDEAILEMCCDWCAMAEEYGNTPFDWAEKTIGSIEIDSYNPEARWRFNNHQYHLIIDTLEKLWGDREDFD